MKNNLPASLSIGLLFSFGVVSSAQAQAPFLPAREQATESIESQSAVLGGKFVIVTYEDDFKDAAGKEIYNTKRQAILPAIEGNTVDTTSVLVETVSGKLATVLVPTASLENSLAKIVQTSNIVRILEVNGSPIIESAYGSYAGFRFNLNGNLFDTPWNADDFQVINQVSEKKSSFSDVAADRWSAGAIYLLASDKIVSGVGSGQFSPSAPVSRAAFLQMLASTAKKAGFDLTKKKDLASDISSASWAKDAASEIKAYLDSQEPGSFDAILQSQSQFKPNQPITRSEAAQIVAFFVNANGNGELSFTDWSGGVEKARVASLISAGAISGVGNGKFDPNGTLTREQMASMAARLLYMN